MANVFSARPFGDDEERALAGPEARSTYSAMAADCPVHRGPDGTPMLTRLGDIVEVNRRRDVLGPGGSGSLMGGQRPLIPLDLDGEEHARYRRLLEPLFSARRVTALEPQVRAMADALIDAFIDLPRRDSDGRHVPVDVHRAFCQPLPSLFFLGLMGIPASDLDALCAFKDTLLGRLPPSMTPPERMAAMREASAGCYAYLDRTFAEREAHADQGVVAADLAADLLGWLMTAELDGERLGRQELLDISYLLILAGLDTVTSSLSCMIAHLAQAPGLRARLCGDPSLWPAAVEELLRVESPVPTGYRFPAVDTEIAGERFAAGETLFVCWASANLDPAAFPDPLTVDLERRGAGHVAFGSGFHRCLGMALARMELRVALEQWHRRIPDYALAPGHVLRFSGKPRAPNGLPLVWG